MFVLLAPYVCYHIFSYVWVTYWKIAAHSTYNVFSWYKYPIVNLVFSHLGFWSGNLFLIAPFPDRCLLVPFERSNIWHAAKSPHRYFWALKFEFVSHSH